MRKLVLGILLYLAIAGTIEERHDFYTYFNPVNSNVTVPTYVYDKEFATSTGDQVVVNGFTRKSIQISSPTIGEYIHIIIQGRLKDMIDDPNWATLDSVEYGNASADTSKNLVVDVTELVDFIRVGVRSEGSAGVSHINIRGIFTNIDR